MTNNNQNTSFTIPNGLSRRQSADCYLTKAQTKRAAKSFRKGYRWNKDAATAIGISPPRLTMYIKGYRCAPIGLFPAPLDKKERQEEATA